MKKRVSEHRPMRPILFSDEMIRAERAGLKTQTRRIVHPQPECSHDGEPYWYVGGYRAWPYRRADVLRSGSANVIRCPYGSPGDRLWVRETHYQFGHWAPVYGQKTKSGGERWHFVADSEEIRFDPPETYLVSRDRSNPDASAWHRRPALSMPRRLARTILEVVSARVERLQDISEEDAMAEGFLPCPKDAVVEYDYGNGYTSARVAFMHSWQRINGEGSWVANHLVWVGEFRRANV